jgi:hypothetical protein
MMTTKTTTKTIIIVTITIMITTPKTTATTMTMRTNMIVREKVVRRPSALILKNGTKTTKKR